MKHFILIIVLLFIVGAHSSIQQRSIPQVVDFVAEKLKSTENISSYVLNTIKKLKTFKSNTENDDAICKSCEVVVSKIITYRKSGASKDSMNAYLNRLCNLFTEWGRVACQGYVEIEIDTILFIIDNKRNLTPKRVCAVHFQANKCVDPDAEKWVIPIPPREIGNDIKDEENKAEPKDLLKILHLTDVHYDPLYKPGSNAVCDEPLCCQSGVPPNATSAAGFWGDYNVCDMPLHSVENLLAHIKKEHLQDVDFIYYTGDIVSHKSWATSIQQNTDSIKEIYGLFSDTFKNITVYPILGNHEPHPTDFYSPENLTLTQLSTEWVFNLVADEWSKWLPESAKSTIKKGGYYSIPVRPGLRIIALNSNVCFTSNLWLTYQDEDPYNQLTWLVKELYEAEKRKEKVHILSHIPAGEILCHKQWSNQFHKIINRFSDTISAQFNGHTHIDEFRVFYNPDDPDQVINVAFNGASFTTFVGFNPNYRIYQVDASNAMVVNYDQYIYNLTAANENKSPPEWYKLYSFKEAYGLPDLKLESFANLIKKMSNDYNLLWQYYRYMVRDSDIKIKEGCDKKCLKQLLCYITAVETNDSVNC